MGQMKFEYNKRLITLTIITLRGFHGNYLIWSFNLIPYAIILLTLIEGQALF
jgi:hypothetical protein